MALSKARVKALSALKHKKFRDEKGIFVAEGAKLISELLPIFECNLLIATESCIERHQFRTHAEVIVIDKQEELKPLTSLTTPPDCLAVFKKQKEEFDTSKMKDCITLVLDGVQDPGNLGTILRTADWFGISDVICSKGTADIYNPKAIQATMGALAHVRVHYTDIIPLLQEAKQNNIPIYGTLLDGNNIYTTPLNNGLIIMGNEGNGISKEVIQYISHKLLIPSFSNGECVESLNVSIATAIVCSEFCRRKL